MQLFQSKWHEQTNIFMIINSTNTALGTELESYPKIITAEIIMQDAVLDSGPCNASFRLMYQNGRENHSPNIVPRGAIRPNNIQTSILLHWILFCSTQTYLNIKQNFLPFSFHFKCLFSILYHLYQMLFQYPNIGGHLRWLWHGSKSPQWTPI